MVTVYSLNVLLSQFGASLLFHVQTVASWPAYRFVRRQVSWFGIPISLRIFQFVVIHTVKGFSIINKAEADIFLEFSCFINDPADVGNLISGSSAFTKSSLNIWKFMVHVLLKPGLENSEHYFTSLWDECDCAVVWAFSDIAFLWDGNENRPFPVLWLLLSFPNLLAYWVQHFNTAVNMPKVGHFSQEAMQKAKKDIIRLNKWISQS